MQDKVHYEIEIHRKDTDEWAYNRRRKSEIEASVDANAMRQRFQREPSIFDDARVVRVRTTREVL